MAYKFFVGQAVEYKPIGAKVGYFKVVRQMPEEFQAIDRKYRIKSDQESFERNVLECDLRPSTMPEEQYGPMKPLRRFGGYHSCPDSEVRIVVRHPRLRTSESRDTSNLLI